MDGIGEPIHVRAFIPSYRRVDVNLPHPIHEFVVILVGTDPKPDKGVALSPGDRPVMQTGIDGPDGALLGKTQ